MKNERERVGGTNLQKSNPVCNGRNASCLLDVESDGWTRGLRDGKEIAEQHTQPRLKLLVIFSVLEKIEDPLGFLESCLRRIQSHLDCGSACITAFIKVAWPDSPDAFLLVRRDPCGLFLTASWFFLEKPSIDSFSLFIRLLHNCIIGQFSKHIV